MLMPFCFCITFWKAYQQVRKSTGMGCSNLIKVLGSRLENASALNTCWKSFTTLIVLPDSNLN